MAENLVAPSHCWQYLLMTNLTLSQPSLNQLAQYDTPTVCNAIELFEVRPHNEGYMDQSIKACFPTLPPMVGYATTATFRAATPAGDSAYSTLEKQIASEVADVCAGIVRAEAVVLEYLNSGKVTPTGLETATTECHRMIDELKASLH